MRWHDRIAVIDQGRIIAQGTPAEIKLRGASAGLEDAFLSLVRQNTNSIEEVLQ